jgi:hypothetical protein
MSRERSWLSYEPPLCGHRFVPLQHAASGCGGDDKKTRENLASPTCQVLSLLMKIDHVTFWTKSLRSSVQDLGAAFARGFFGMFDRLGVNV